MGMQQGRNLSIQNLSFKRSQALCNDTYITVYLAIILQVVIGGILLHGFYAIYKKLILIFCLQVVLSCKRMSSGEAFDCETQTFHFSRASASTLVFVPNSNTPETIKVEIDTDQVSHVTVCPVMLHNDQLQTCMSDGIHCWGSTLTIFWVNNVILNHFLFSARRVCKSSFDMLCGGLWCLLRHRDRLNLLQSPDRRKQTSLGWNT